MTNPIYQMKAPQYEMELPKYGWELEPELGYIAPPSKVTTPAVREGTLKLTEAAPADVLICKARVPVPLTLEGPVDLVFASLTLTLEAQQLVRNLNQAGHQVVVAPVASPANTYEFRLPEPAYVDRVQLPSLSASVTAIGPGGQEKPLVRNLYTFACGMSVSAIRVSGYTGDTATVNILSPSSASHVVVALPDGTPLHSFPAVFDPQQAVSATSRDLKELVNKAWAEAGGKLELTVTAMTDGALKVTAAGQWRRTAALDVEQAVHPFASVEVPVPVGQGWQQAGLRLTVDATGTGGLTTRMQPLEPAVPLRRFGVQVTETLQIAQAFCLRADSAGLDEALPASHVTGVWLCLPAVPDQAQELDLRLTRATAEQQPDPTPLLLWKAKLPADASAYVDTGAEVWFRAPCPKPLEIDGTTVARPLFLVASGHGAGTLLVHRNLRTKLEPVTLEDLDGLVQDGLEIDFPLDEPGRQLVGATLVSNLAVDRGWASQSFNCYSALWRFELELAPDAPAALLVTATLADGTAAEGTVPEGLTLEGVELTFPPVPVTEVLSVQVRSRASGSVTVYVLAEEVS
jgi:hypothetical protein